MWVFSLFLHLSGQAQFKNALTSLYIYLGILEPNLNKDHLWCGCNRSASWRTWSWSKDCHSRLWSPQCDTEPIFPVHSKCIAMKHADRLMSIAETAQAFYPNRGHARCCRSCDQISWMPVLTAVSWICYKFQPGKETPTPHQLQTTKFAEDMQLKWIWTQGKGNANQFPHCILLLSVIIKHL